tara:strand:- start:87 stop:581 length:495 start_codon:yes stop_codon:yes gene_type:complete
MQNCCFFSEISGQNDVFPFFGENFVTLFSALANYKLAFPPTKSPMDCESIPEQPVKNFLVSAGHLFWTNIATQKKVVLPFTGYMYRYTRSKADPHPKRSPWPDFHDRGVSIRATKRVHKKTSFLGRLACVHTVLLLYLNVECRPRRLKLEIGAVQLLDQFKTLW